MSQAARIRRGSASARPSARSVAAKPKAAARRAEAQATDLLEVLPISAKAIGRIVRWGAGAVLLGLLLVIAFAFQLPQMAGTALGEAVGRAGFTVKSIEIRPLTMTRERRLAVNFVASDQESMAMPLVDIDQIRAQLLTIGWVKEARVSRRLPETLAIESDARQPAAIWQNRGKLSLIDADGVVLDPVRLDAMPDLPLVIGPAANLQATALTRLLADVPTLKSMMAGATWIGGRRWDVRFQSGEVLALPEGEAAAKKALVKFARLDGTAGLLGKGLVRFDMRIPGKMFIRMSSEPGKRVQIGDLGRTI